MSRIIAVASIPVKPTRRTPKAAGRFGAGILPSAPAYAAPFRISDDAWWATERAAAEDRHFDALEREAIALARIDMGLLF